ncbi:MAG TPA: response regulator transcription factor [Candidatus Lumbricidophila sp.]|nr:response regulator transcription factor [Candidatus Lumbricidophila sp.]
MRALVSAERGLSVVAVAASTRAAVDAVIHHQPGVLLILADTPGLAWPILVNHFANAAPQTKVVVVGPATDHFPAPSADARAPVLISRQCTARDIIAAIRQPGLCQTRANIAPETACRLTPRERQVLHLIADGRSNGEIAGMLSIATGTVKRHTSQIFHRLGAKSRTDAVRRAYAIGEISF